MRVAALYDIHGNLPALDAVLAEVERARVDLIVVGGDVVPGPFPRQTIERLLDLDVPTRFISGNGDRIVLALMTGGDVTEVPVVFRDIIEWNAQQLDEDCRPVMESWPATCEVDVAGLGQVLFCHATPRNDIECFTRVTPDDLLAPVFRGVTSGIVVCGHTHVQFDRMVGKLRVVNAGSVGMPFAPPRGAHWLLLDGDVRLRQTSYDVDAAAAQMRATGMPQVEMMAVRYVLNPPTEAETLAMYAPAEAAFK